MRTALIRSLIAMLAVVSLFVVLLTIAAAKWTWDIYWFFHE